MRPPTLQHRRRPSPVFISLRNDPRPRRPLDRLATGLATVVLALTVGGASAQEPIDLSPYFPLRSGDLWTYEVAGAETWARTVTSQVELEDGRTAYRLDERSQDHSLRLVDEAGLWLVSLHFAGGVDIVFDEPVLLVPRSLAVGATHRADVGYSVIEQGVPSHEGSQVFEVQRLSDRSVDTPAGVFEGALILRIRSRREALTGAVAEAVHLETRVADLGLVRLERPGSGPAEGDWTASLTGASVGGRLLPD